MSKQRKNDIILISLLIFSLSVVTIIIWFYLFGNHYTKERDTITCLTIYVDGAATKQLKMDEAQNLRLELNNGDYNIVQIVDNKASIIEANCKDQICVKHKEISQKEESIICLPHKLVLSIEVIDNDCDMNDINNNKNQNSDANEDVELEVDGVTW